MPVKYIELMKQQLPEVAEATPVLNWLVSKIGQDPRAVNLWAIDYPSYAAISGGFVMVEGRPLERPDDIVMDTVLSRATGLRVGDRLPLMNRQFTLSGICRAGAGGRLYARIQDVQDAIGTPGKASFFLVKGAPGTDAEALARALEEKFKGHKITPVAQVSKAMQENAIGLQQFKQAIFPTLAVTLTRDWALIAAGLGLVGGLLGSLYPGARAARLDPIQALNFE
jgi:putative ABC transport system permease protein